MIPLQHGLILAAILFVLGLTGLLIRRNLLFMLISLEVMINAAALAFVVAGSYWGAGRRSGDVYPGDHAGGSRGQYWPGTAAAVVSSPPYSGYRYSQ